MYSYHIWRAWYNGSYTMMAKPIRALGLHYPMIQFLIIINIVLNKCSKRLQLFAYIDLSPSFDTVLLY